MALGVGAADPGKAEEAAFAKCSPLPSRPFLPSGPFPAFH